MATWLPDTTPKILNGVSVPEGLVKGKLMRTRLASLLQSEAIRVRGLSISSTVQCFATASYIYIYTPMYIYIYIAQGCQIDHTPGAGQGFPKDAMRKWCCDDVSMLVQSIAIICHEASHCMR